MSEYALGCCVDHTENWFYALCSTIFILQRKWFPQLVVQYPVVSLVVLYSFTFSLGGDFAAAIHMLGHLASGPDSIVFAL